MTRSSTRGPRRRRSRRSSTSWRPRGPRRAGGPWTRPAPASRRSSGQSRTRAALALSEQALQPGRYEDVARELADVRETAEPLTLGLEAAAKDLVRVAEEEIARAKADGIQATRAETVLGDARDALADRRY